MNGAANFERAEPVRLSGPIDKRVIVPIMFRLTLAGSAAGGMTVVTERNCHGEGAAQVVTSSVRHGPKGTAARISADLSGEVTVVATFTFTGICRAATSFNFTGGAEPGAALSRLRSDRKTVA